MAKRKRKICVVITARPSYSRVKTALSAIQQHEDLDLSVIAAGSFLLDRYGSAVDVLISDGFEVSEQVHMVVEGENPIAMAKTTGLATIELATVLNRIAPDAVVTIADRYETLATATAAAYLQLPLVHLQGGELSGNIDEKVRHAVTKLADLHLVCTEPAAARLVGMGEVPETIHITGCPSIDLAAAALDDSALDFDPIQVYGGVGPDLDLTDGYVVVMQHPVTSSYTDARAQATETLLAIEELALPTLWFWPNPDAGSDQTSAAIRHFRETHDPENIHFFKNVPPHDFLKLLVNSQCLIGNSSVGIRECSYMGVPVVNIGNRQRGRDRGPNVEDVAHDATQIVDAALSSIAEGRPKKSSLYGGGDAGRQIADVLAVAPLSTEKRLNF